MQIHMKLTSFIGVAETALFVATGCASAATITIFQTSFNDSGSNTAPAGFTLLDLGTGASPGTQSVPAVPGITSFAFSNGNPANPSGLYAGNSGGLFASPFGVGNGTTNYLVAGANGGSVAVTWDTLQTELWLLWGTVDIDDGRNLVVAAGGQNITGEEVWKAIINPLNPFPYYGHGDTDVYLKITGLDPFLTATFSDNSSAAFEFALGFSAEPGTRSVPGPIVGAGLPGLVFAAGALLAFARRRRKTS